MVGQEEIRYQWHGLGGQSQITLVDTKITQYTLVSLGGIEMTTKIRLMLGVDQETHAWLDEAAGLYGVSKAEFIRRVLRREQHIWHNPVPAPTGPEPPDSLAHSLLSVLRTINS